MSLVMEVLMKAQGGSRNTQDFSGLIPQMNSKNPSLWPIVRIVGSILLAAGAVSALIFWIAGAKPFSHPGSSGASPKVSPDKYPLEGLVLDELEPSCLIQGQILKVGDKWQGKRIIAINQKGVFLAGRKGHRELLQNK